MIMILIFLFALSYLFKHVLISGCLLYPVFFTCIDFLPWSYKEMVQGLAIGSEAMNKSIPQYMGNLSMDEYIKNFNWISTWFARTKIELIEFLSLLSFIFLISCLLFFGNKNPNQLFLLMLIGVICTSLFL